MRGLDEFGFSLRCVSRFCFGRKIQGALVASGTHVAHRSPSSWTDCPLRPERAEPRMPLQVVKVRFSTLLPLRGWLRGWGGIADYELGSGLFPRVGENGERWIMGL